MVIGQLDRPEILVNAAGHFVDRHAVGGDGVPDPDEPDPDVLAHFLWWKMRPEFFSDPLVGPFDLQIMVAIPPIGTIGGTGQTMKFGFVVSFDETLAVDQT